MEANRGTRLRLASKPLRLSECRCQGRHLPRFPHLPGQRGRGVFAQTQSKAPVEVPQREELRSADSLQDGSVAVFTPHCAFQDPTAPEGTPTRQSIELRALVFYD